LDIIGENVKELAPLPQRNPTPTSSFFCPSLQGKNREEHMNGRGKL